jgi:hypothetical protein
MMDENASMSREKLRISFLAAPRSLDRRLIHRAIFNALSAAPHIAVMLATIPIISAIILRDFAQREFVIARLIICCSTRLPL